MSSKRFDISVESRFESRNGGITKGGLVRNGFSEVDGAGERWSWMRPSLATGVTAEIPGGMGLFKVGTDLYGMGTSGSWLVQLGGTTAWAVNAADFGGIFGYGISTSAGTSTTGSLSPLVWKGKTVSELFSGPSSLTVSFFGAVNTGVFTWIRFSTRTALFNQAVVSTADGQTHYDWGTIGLYTATGTFTGAFK